MDVFFYLPKELENLWRKRFLNTSDYKKWVIEKFLEDVNENWGVEDYKREIENKELILKKEEIEISKLKIKISQIEQEKKQKQKEYLLKQKQEEYSDKEYLKNQRQNIERWISIYFEGVNKLISKSLSKEFFETTIEKRSPIKEFVEKRGFKFKEEIHKKNPILHKELISK